MGFSSNRKSQQRAFIAALYLQWRRSQLRTRRRRRFRVPDTLSERYQLGEFYRPLQERMRMDDGLFQLQSFLPLRCFVRKQLFCAVHTLEHPTSVSQCDFLHAVPEQQHAIVCRCEHDLKLKRCREAAHNVRAMLIIVIIKK